MVLLADCVLAIDGKNFPLSRPSAQAPGAAAGLKQLRFGIASVDAPRLAPLVGRTGIVHTRSGVVLLRLQLQSVDQELNLLSGQQVAP